MFEEKIVKVNNIEYINVTNENCNFLFSLKNPDGDYKRNGKEFNDKLKELCQELKINELGYSDQIHSSIINIYDGTIKKGDATISDKEGIGVCIYTADCVPILIKHKFLPIKAAIHSGWKGTYDIILLKTIKLLERKYKINSKDLICCVGPHIRACCYEVSQEMIDDFKSHELYFDKGVYNERLLDLTKCIEIQLDTAGILQDNCYFSVYCTKCSDKYKFHSYRNDKECGRILSLVY